MLVGFNAAAYAVSLEAKSDAATVGEMMAWLRATYDNVPNPTASFVTRWRADPFALGSYSYTAKNNLGPRKAHTE